MCASPHIFPNYLSLLVSEIYAVKNRYSRAGLSWAGISWAGSGRFIISNNKADPEIPIFFKGFTAV